MSNIAKIKDLPGFVTAVITALIGLVLLQAGRAQASLGQKEDSIDTDCKQIVGVRRISTMRNAYTIHEIVNKRVTIREYASGGVIFAVSWTGSRHPDLSGLLGKYFQEVQDASRHSAKVKGVRFHGRLQSRNVVIEKSGHMRWIQGKAYVSHLIPKVVSLSEIQ